MIFSNSGNMFSVSSEHFKIMISFNFNFNFYNTVLIILLIADYISYVAPPAKVHIELLITLFRQMHSTSTSFNLLFPEAVYVFDKTLFLNEVLKKLYL